MIATQEKTPVPAATVTLVRDGGHGLEVLMMERNLQSGFVPGSYLFPGGAVDAQDAAPDASGLCAGLDDARASALLGVASGGLAYWVAAIREIVRGSWVAARLRFRRWYRRVDPRRRDRAFFRPPPRRR